MQDLNDLYFFAKAVEHQGFAPASRAIGVPKSKLSRRVSQLEERLGVRLIQRSTRSFVITDAGQRFYEHCRAMLVEAEAAQEAIDAIQTEPRGIIRMTCPVGLLNFHVGGMLAEFMVKYPNVTVHLEPTNRRVDVLGEGMDLALRVRPLPLEDSDLVVRILSGRMQCMVASPSLVSAHGLPREPEDLVKWPSMSRGTSHENHSWVLENTSGDKRTVHFNPRYVTTDMQALKLAAVAGVGVVQLPNLMLRDELERGELVHVLSGWAPRQEMIHIVFPSRRGLLPAVRALIDFLADKYAAIDEI